MVWSCAEIHDSFACSCKPSLPDHAFTGILRTQATPRNTRIASAFCRSSEWDTKESRHTIRANARIRDIAVALGEDHEMGTKRTGKGRRKIGRKKRRMRAKIRHRK